MDTFQDTYLSSSFELGGITIARVLIESGRYDHDRINRFLVFLKNFLYINDPEINRIFDEQIIQLSGGTIDMGIIEVVKKQERQKGRLEERAKAAKLLQEERAKAEAEKRAIALEFKKMGIPVADISKGTGLTIEEIEKLK